MPNNLKRIKATLLTAGMQRTNPALYQSLNDIIDFAQDNLDHIDSRLTLITSGSGGGGGAPASSTFLTTTDEHVDLPNSRELLPGTGIAFDDTVAHQRTISTQAITALTGDVTATGPGSVPATIANDAVTNAKLANMAQSTIKGRAVGAGTGDPTDLTATQATAILNNMVGDSGAGGTKGLAPAPAAGDAAAGKFLKADGTYAVPPGTGTGTVTHTGSLTADQLVLGNGSADIKPLGAAGTTTQVLHGNASGAPSFSAVVEADITLANNTTNDVSTTKHGFAPILPNDATKFLNGTGAYSVPTRTTVFGLTIDGAGAVITTGVKGFVRIPISCTITKVTVLSTNSAATAGSIVIDVWKDTYANYPPTVIDSITASAKPTLSSANKSEDSTLTGWTKSVTAGDVIGFNVDSVTTLTRVLIEIEASVP